jgi:hypothetical protein
MLPAERLNSSEPPRLAKLELLNVFWSASVSLTALEVVPLMVLASNTLPVGCPFIVV